MILANFDLSFFTSIPGLLITGGVLLLLIALIIFIATGSKKGNKGKKEEKVEDAVNATPQVDNSGTVATMDVAPDVTPTPAVQAVGPSPVVSAPDTVVSSTPEAGNAVVNSAPASVNTEPKVETPQVTPVVETPTVNSVNVEPVSNSTVANNAVQPVVETPQVVESPTPTVETPTSSSVTPNVDVAASEPITIVNEEPKVEAPKPIYGGVSSVIPKIDVAGEEHRPIYGGADPLENTGTIPTINKQPSNVEIPVVTPSVPQVEEQPKVEPVTVSVPQVEVPTVETPHVEVPKQEVVTPTVTETIPKVDTTPAAPKQDDEIESLF